MTRAESAVRGLSGGGMTLGSYSGIAAVNSETATIAGFMLMSIPFLAAGLARGAMSIAGQATSMLAPAQNAAEAAAVEQTTGNYSYGNVSWANSTSNMRQSDQWTTAPSYMGGNAAMSWRHDNGAVVSGFGNGQEVIDVGAAMSKLAFTPTATSGNVAEWREMASAAHRQSQAYENAAQELITWTKTDRSGTSRSTETTSGWDSSAGRSANTSLDRFDRTTASSSQGVDEGSSIRLSASASNTRERSASTTEQVGGTVSGGLSPGRGGKGAGAKGSGLLGGLPSVSGSVSWQGQQGDLLRHGSTEGRSSEASSTSNSSFRDEHSNGSGASEGEGTYERAGTFSRASTTSSVSVRARGVISGVD